MAEIVPFLRFSDTAFPCVSTAFAAETVPSLAVLRYLANVGVIMMIFAFIYSVVGVALFTNVIKQDVLGSNLNFQNFGWAMSTLLLIASGENWTDLMRECMITEDSGCGRCVFRAGWISMLPLECLRNAAQPPGSRTRVSSWDSAPAAAIPIVAAC